MKERIPTLEGQAPPLPPHPAVSPGCSWTKHKPAHAWMSRSAEGWLYGNKSQIILSRLLVYNSTVIPCMWITAGQGQVGGLDEEQAALLASFLEKHVKGGERRGGGAESTIILFNSFVVLMVLSSLPLPKRKKSLGEGTELSCCL